VAEAYNVQGLPVEVVFDEGRYYVYIRSWSERNEDLRTVLSLAHSCLRNLPPIPDLVEVPVHQQAEEILEAQGWERASAGWHTKAEYMVGVNVGNACLWTLDTGTGNSLIRTVPLTQGKVREQLKELLTFPQWKEP
jgi:hypothetical protein